MPRRTTRRTSRRSSGLPAPIAAIARSAARQYKRDQMVEAIAASAPYFGEANAASGNIRTRYSNALATGRGAYKLGRSLRKFGAGKFGQALQGAMTNTAIGAMSGAGMYTGHGAYQSNELIPGKADLAMIPSFASAGDETGALTICHKEYVCDIYGPSSSFNVQSYAINPGLEQSFPWLSQIAQNYDEYNIHQLIYTFRSTTTDVGTTTNGQCGTIVMGTNYNAGAAVWRDKTTMMQYDAVMSGKCTETLLHGVECDPDKLSGAHGKYIRANPVLTDQDVKTYDHGLFQLAVCNSPGGFVNESIGELWVSYTVELRKPKFFTARGLGISQDIFVSGAGTETTERPLGTQAGLLRAQSNNIGCKLNLNTINIIDITFPAAYAGYVILSYQAEGANLSTWNCIGSVLSGNIALVNDIYGSHDTGSSDSPANLVRCISTTQVMISIHLQVNIATNGQENKYRLTHTQPGNTYTQAQLKIQEYNSGFSYRAANEGENDAPILINSAGQIVVP